MSSQNTPKYLQYQEPSQECKELVATLPREKWYAFYMYRYQGFWYEDRLIPWVISCQKEFEVKDYDVFLATTPKSGTTWLKALMFTLSNRNQYPVADNIHPLLTHNPHDLAPNLEINVYMNQILDIASIPSPRLFSTHLSHGSLPESMKHSSACKVVYLCRNPKDAFVSLWHYVNKVRPQAKGTNSFGEIFEMFCNGVSPFGPFWDHVLEYWKQSKEDPERVFFLKYEAMKDQPALHLRRLAEFLGCPFSADEEESGLVAQILKFCSFDNMRSLEVNKKGKLLNGVENSAFFRRGEVGDWKNHLSAEMVEKIDQITEENFYGSGLVL